MELQTAIEILEYHQEWRLGTREDMIHEPKKLTEALDIVLSEVKKFRLAAVSGSGEPVYLTRLETRTIRGYNPKYGDDKKCDRCGHEYRRHFDTYEGMLDVGCKYCPCMTFTEASH